MGQQLIENYINELNFTTINELHKLIDEEIMGKQSIINSIRRLKKREDIKYLTIGREDLLFDNTFWGEVTNE